MKPRVGIFGLSGCWGEQIAILNCEDELLDLVGALEIVDFLGGSSVNDVTGPLDVALVEGSVGSARERKALERIRERAGLVVACGTCACAGGVASMECGRPRRELLELVYGATAAGFDSLEHQPLQSLVKVDARIPGCPMEKEEFLRVVAGLLNGDAPIGRATPVCHECRMKEWECVLLAEGAPCMGPVTLCGCGARCPGYGVGCIGCRGPVEEANADGLLAILRERHPDAAALGRRLRSFAAPIFAVTRPGGAP